VTTATYRRAIDLMEADVGGELVALDPEGGNCFGFNEVATWVWRRLAEPATFEQLRDGLLAEYEVSPAQCSSELQELLDYLGRRGLVKCSGTNGR
jgi:Coenzyme PQQ synthesis protein D (PqqD)